ncbi:(E2-independent) E3 ubiquitin-conjugating enzyme FATS [Menidia menidia]
MALRRPPAPLRRAPDWRRSGSESYWDSLTAEEEFSPRASQPPRASRPQSAIEGGQLDSWLEHLQRMQGEVRAPGHDQSFNDRTASTPVLHRELTGPAWRKTALQSPSRDSSSCGSSSLFGSSLDSQESFQTGRLSPPERRGSRERVHIMQAPTKEKTQLSYLAPVKTGWLPIQRRVMMVGDAHSQKTFLDHSAGQVKLKQPITPAFQKNQVSPWPQDGEVERSYTSPSAVCVDTWRTADQHAPDNNEVPEKPSLSANEGDGSVGWRALRRGWRSNRVPAFPRGNKLNEPPTGTTSDLNRKSHLMRATGAEPIEHLPLCCTTSADPWNHPSQRKGANDTDANKSHTLFRRTSSLQPVKATAPPHWKDNSKESAHILSSSGVKTLIPQNKAGFSSITISSRKVCRSASLPGSKTTSSSSQSSKSPSPPFDHQPMDPNSGQVTVQRKATIIKVTEKRVISSVSPSPDTRPTRTSPLQSHSVDTVVRRRKATVIKVTEHKESYNPPKLGSRHPEYRHSYTEGVYRNSSIWSEGNPSEQNAVNSYRCLNSAPSSGVAPSTFSSQTDKHDALHRSTLNLFVSNSPVLAAPTSLEASPKAVGQRLDRLPRPLSCYGNFTGHTEPSKANVTPTPARNWNSGLPRESHTVSVNSDSGFISPGKAVKGAGQLMTGAPKPTRGEKERLPPSEDKTQRVTPCLTLIKAPDPNSHQSQEEVLALNAAAIIANIKLQRQLSMKKTSSGNSEEDAAASPQGNTETDGRKNSKPNSKLTEVQHNEQPHTAFVPQRLDHERSAGTISLQQALQKSRPDFISRSQGRLQKLEQKARERRERSGTGDQQEGTLRQKSARSPRPTSVNGNHFRPRGGDFLQPRSKHAQADLKKKNEEEKKRKVCLSNRQRVELFKKKTLAQVLQRSKN